MAVPDNENFSLSHVIEELDLSDRSIGLADCFNNCDCTCFDPRYNCDSYTPANSLLRFRNYAKFENLITIIETKGIIEHMGTKPEYVIKFHLFRGLSSKANVKIRIGNYENLGSSIITDLELKTGAHEFELRLSPNPNLTNLKDINIDKNPFVYTVTILGVDNGMNFSSETIAGNFVNRKCIWLHDCTAERFSSSGYNYVKYKYKLMSNFTGPEKLDVFFKNYDGKGGSPPYGFVTCDLWEGTYMASGTVIASKVYTGSFDSEILLSHEHDEKYHCIDPGRKTLHLSSLKNKAT